MLRYGDLNPSRARFEIALALIAMMMRVQDPLNFAHTEIAEVVEDLT